MCSFARCFFLANKTADRVVAAMAVTIKMSAGLPNSGIFGVGELVTPVEPGDVEVGVGAAVDVEERDITETVVAFSDSAPPFAMKTSFLAESKVMD